jgi:hypothetical protein
MTGHVIASAVRQSRGGARRPRGEGSVREPPLPTGLSFSPLKALKGAEGL